MAADARLESLRRSLHGRSIEGWLAAVREAGVSPQGVAHVARALRLGGSLLAAHPDSLASLLLGSTLGVAALASLRAAWLAETLTTGRPWIRTLAEWPLTAGLEAALVTSGLDLTGLGALAFPADEVVTLGPTHLRAPGQRLRTDRLRWSWRTGRAELEPQPPEPPSEIERSGDALWLVAGGRRTRLPTPAESFPHASPGRTGAILVHGAHEELAGGFVWRVRRDRSGHLVSEERLETDDPVWSAEESRDGRVILARTRLGLVTWVDGEPRSFALRCDEAALAPDGERVAVATRQDVRVVSLRELAQGRVEPGFRATFSPSGARLLRGRRLFDGGSGTLVADLRPVFGQHLEGGPAQPSFHVGERHVLNFHAMNTPQAWRSSDGAPLAAGQELHFPHWDQLAYDRDGARLAVLRHRAALELLALPSGERLAWLDGLGEGLEGLALSPTGDRVAVRRGDVVEVRDWSGRLLRRGAHPVARPPDPRARLRRLLGLQTLRFVGEDAVESHGPPDGWWRFGVSDGRVELVEASPSDEPWERPEVQTAGWTVRPEGPTLFVHDRTGTRIALPIAGPWRVHPARPEVVASEEGHLELVG